MFTDNKCSRKHEEVGAFGRRRALRCVLRIVSQGPSLAALLLRARWHVLNVTFARQSGGNNDTSEYGVRSVKRHTCPRNTHTHPNTRSRECVPAVIITFQTVSSAKLNCNWHTVGVTSPFSGWLVQRGSSKWSLKWAVQICFNAAWSRVHPGEGEGH